MSIRRPDYLPGHYYHLYNRGAHRDSIFREEDNYLFLLRKVKAYCCSLSLTPIAYSLLPNHYHFLIHQDGEEPAGRLPQRVFNSYTKAYNRRYGHSGTLFEGNYRAVVVDDDTYLLHLCRYIHANPVIHGMVADPADWPYSNYLEWIGEREGILVDRDFVRAHFPPRTVTGLLSGPISPNVACRRRSPPIYESGRSEFPRGSPGATHLTSASHLFIPLEGRVPCRDHHRLCMSCTAFSSAPCPALPIVV